MNSINKNADFIDEQMYDMAGADSTNPQQPTDYSDSLHFKIS